VSECLSTQEKTRVLLSNAAGGGGDDGGGDLTDADSSPQTQPSRYQRAISNVLVRVSTSLLYQLS